MSEHQHFIIHKPYGFLTQFVYNLTTRKNRKLLGELHDFPDGIMAIGRLDQDSEGLLFLTTDGKMSHLVRSSKVEKEYHVQVDGLITQNAIELLQKGTEIGFKGERYLTKPSKVTILDPQPNYLPRTKPVRDDRHGPSIWISIIIKEGKFRQVRKMTASVGFPTLRLIRYRIGKETIDNLKSGNVKQVNEFDL